VAYWQFDLLVLVLPAVLLLRGTGRPPMRLWGAVAALSVVALAWTAPWDEHLVRTGVWSYGADRVVATLGSVPVEEYAFVVLLVVLVAAWGVRTGRLPAAPGLGGEPGPRAAGALVWLGVAAAGTVLLAVGGTWRYLGLLLVWVAPPLALQRAVAGDLLRRRRADRLLVAAPVALWLCAADRLALADGVWLISPASSSGILLLGLPVEEALFFCLVTLLVTDGLFLATDAAALSRAGGLLRARRRRRVASAT
jgi:lycopene beta-cyclase